MWEALLKVQKFIQTLRPLRIQYSCNKNGFHENHSQTRKIYSALIDTNQILIWLASWIGLNHALSKNNSSENQTSVQQQVLGMVVQVLYVGIFALVLASTWTFQFRGNATVWLMSQVENFNIQRKLENLNPINKTKKPNLDLFDIFLYGMVGSCAIGALIIGMMPLLTQNTPAHFILKRILLPENILSELSSKPVVFTLICCAYLLIFGVFGTTSILQVLIFMCGILHEFTIILKPKNVKLFSGRRFFNAKQIYMKSYLFAEQYNMFGCVYFPVIITTGFVINVVTSIICIEFHSELPIMLVTCFAGLDVITWSLCVGLHSFAMVINEDGIKFRKFWKSRLIKRRDRKELCACMPIICKIGPFFALKRTTLLRTMSEIVNAIVNILIVDQ